ncbi:MAG: hypothetical protein R6X33_01670 [Candidatus Brocadiia bacterium]
MNYTFRDISVGAFAVVVVLWLGCRTATPESPPSEPDWVSSARRTAQEGRFISAVGSAGTDQPDAMLAADRQARQELATLVSEYVNTRVGDFLESSVVGTDAGAAPAQGFRRTLASDVAAIILRSVERKDTWHEPGGTTYVLYQIPTEALDERITRRAEALVQQGNPFEVAPETLSEALGDFLANREQARAARAEPSAPSTRKVETGTEDTAPPWLESPPEDRFPPERYLTAVGLGPSIAQAEADGRAEIAGRVNAALQVLMRSGVAGEAALPPGNRAVLRDLRPRFLPAEVPAVRSVAYWLDQATRQYYVLLALDRTQAASSLGKDARGALAQFRRAVQSTDPAGKPEDFASDFRRAATAWETARRAVDLQARAIAVAPAAEQPALAGLIEEPIVRRAEDRLRSFAQSMQVTTVRGDEQIVRPGHSPAEPFVVRVSRGEQNQPVAGIPVRLIGPGPDSALLGRPRTDEAGAAAWRAGAALPRRGMRGAVVAEVDLPYLTPDTDLPELPTPSVRFTYYFRSPSTTSFVVALEGGVAATEAASAVRTALLSEGFSPVERAELLAHTKAVLENSGDAAVRSTDAFAELADRLGPSRSLLVVTGTVESNLAEEAETSEGLLAIAECPFSVRVLDPGMTEGARLVAEVSGAGRGSRLDDRGEALRLAREDAVRRLTEQLLEALR